MKNFDKEKSNTERGGLSDDSLWHVHLNSHRTGRQRRKQVSTLTIGGSGQKQEFRTGGTINGMLCCASALTWRCKCGISATGQFNRKIFRPANDSVKAHAKWSNFWDLVNTETAAQLMLEVYGAIADRAATEGANAAITDGRGADHHFWLEVIKRIGVLQKARRRSAQAIWEADGLFVI